MERQHCQLSGGGTGDWAGKVIVMPGTPSFGTGFHSCLKSVSQVMSAVTKHFASLNLESALRKNGISA